MILFSKLHEFRTISDLNDGNCPGKIIYPLSDLHEQLEYYIGILHERNYSGQRIKWSGFTKSVR